MRDGGRCIWPTCRKPLTEDPDKASSPWSVAHGHELVNRSQGGDPLNVDEVVTVCAACHHDLHVRLGGKRKRIIGDTVPGGLRFEERLRGDVWKEVGPCADR